MFNLLIAGFSWLIRYLFAGKTILWGVGALLWYGSSILIDTLLTFLPSWFNAAGLGQLFGALTPGMWYFFDYFQGGLILSMSMGAIVARFLIRRIPVFG